MSKLGTTADSDVMLDPCSDSITCGVSTLTVTGASCTDSLRCRAAVTTTSLSSFSPLEAFAAAPLSGLDMVVGATPGRAAAESVTVSAPAGEMAAKPIDATSAAINLIFFFSPKPNFPPGGKLVVI